VLDVSDADADAIQTYRLWDTAVGVEIRSTAHRIVANTAVDVAAGSLSQGDVRWQSSSAGSQTLWIQAYDGGWRVGELARTLGGEYAPSEHGARPVRDRSVGDSNRFDFCLR
jgi:hypothetical protein